MAGHVDFGRLGRVASACSGSQALRDSTTTNSAGDFLGTFLKLQVVLRAQEKERERERERDIYIYIYTHELMWSMGED